MPYLPYKIFLINVWQRIWQNLCMKPLFHVVQLCGQTDLVVVQVDNSQNLILWPQIAHRCIVLWRHNIMIIMLMKSGKQQLVKFRRLTNLSGEQVCCSSHVCQPPNAILVCSMERKGHAPQTPKRHAWAYMQKL